MNLLTSPGQPETQTSGLAGRIPSRRPSTARLLLLVVPTVVVGMLVAVPILYLIIRSLGASQSAWQLLVRTRTLEILGNTVLLAVSVTASCSALALIFGWLTVRTDLRGRRFWSVATMLPLVIPSYVGAYLFAAAFGPRGLLQQLLEGLAGIERLPGIYGFPGAFLVLTLLSFPYSLITVRAALQRMDPALEESARSLGYGPWSTFWRITFPQLRPALVAGGLLVGLYTLRDFGAVSLMRYTTFTRAIYIQYQSAFDRSSAALLSTVLVVMTLAVLFLEGHSRSRGRYHSAEGSSRRLSTVRLGRWAWPAWLLCAAVVSLALLIPAGVLVFWLVRGVQAGESLAPLWEPVRNSITASTLAAGLTIAAALPIVIAAVRRPARWNRYAWQVAHVGFALPGIVIALAMVHFGSQYAPWIYGTLPVLLAAYIILFLPQAMGALRTSLLQVHPNLEEAARSLGRKPISVFRQVTLPLVRPGLMAGAALVFLTTMKELQATLILGPFGFKTLATVVWSAVSEAFFAKAAAPALLLILTSSIPMAYFVIREQRETQ